MVKDEVFIYQIAPDKRGGKAYKLVYLVEVSIDLFKAIERWQKNGVADELNLENYLMSLEGISTEEARNFLTAHKNNSESNGSSDSRGGDCNCTVLTMNTAHEIVPNPMAQFNHDGHDGGSWFWDRVFFKSCCKDIPTRP